METIIDNVTKNKIKFFAKNFKIGWEIEDIIEKNEFWIKAYLLLDFVWYLQDEQYIDWKQDKDKSKIKICFYVDNDDNNKFEELTYSEIKNKVLNNKIPFENIQFIFIENIKQDIFIIYDIANGWNKLWNIEQISILQDSNIKNEDLEYINRKTIIKNKNNLWIDQIFLSDWKKITISLDIKRRPDSETIDLWNGVSTVFIQTKVKLFDLWKALNQVYNNEWTLDSLFNKNVRTFLWIQTWTPWEEIIKTLFDKDESKYFFIYNSWIVSVWEHVISLEEWFNEFKWLKIAGFNIINWAQTSSVIFEIYRLIYDFKEWKNINLKWKEILKMIFLYDLFYELDIDSTSSNFKEEILRSLENKFKEILFYTLPESFKDKFLEIKFNSKTNQNINKIIDIMINDKELMKMIIDRFETNLSSSSISLKIYSWLKTDLIEKVTRFNNFQRKVDEDLLFSKSLEVILMKDYMESYTNKSIVLWDDISLDEFMQISFIYLSTKSEWFLDYYSRWARRAKNAKRWLYLDWYIRSKIFDFSNEETIKNIIFYVLLYKKLDKIIEKIFPEWKTYENIDFFNQWNLFHIIYVLAFLKVHEKFNNIDELIDNNNTLLILKNYINDWIWIFKYILDKKDNIWNTTFLYRISKFDEDIENHFFPTKISKEAEKNINNL